MSDALNMQQTLREEVLKNIDLNIVDELIDNREGMVLEVAKLLDATVEKENIYVEKKTQRYIAEQIADEIMGFGPLQSLLEDESVSDILVNGPNDIFIERRGVLEKTPYRFLNNNQLTDIAKRLVQKVGRRLDEGQPLVDARLPDGSRLNVAIGPIALDGTAISIRKFGKGHFGLDRLVDAGAMSSEMANLLVIIARCKINVIISGGTGSGKTTLLNALSQYIGKTERIITMEDAAELRLVQPHVLRLETRLAGVENTGLVSMRDLLINALRMRPDRIIVGECRGMEAFEMLQAMNTGHDGSMSTLHANTPRDAIARLENMVMMAGLNMPLSSIRRNVASAVNIIIQVSRLNDGSRKVMNISEVMGIEGEQIILQDIFTFKATEERDEHKRIQGEFINHGLLSRSQIMKNAVMFDVAKDLKSIFGME